MVVSGAPEKDYNHGEKVCDMALDMVYYSNQDFEFFCDIK